MGKARLYAVRGATSVPGDTREAIVDATRTMLAAVLDRNAIEPDDIVSILFTATGDLHTEFPAAAARAVGLKGVPMLCARELDVEGSPLVIDRCVRVLMHYYGDRRPEPVYLGEASKLLDLVRRDEDLFDDDCGARSAEQAVPDG